jgi:pyruvate, water dikinase
MLKFFARLFRSRKQLDPDEARSAIRERYRNFRALLTANNNALELMSVAEEMLHSGKPFGMTFVRGDITALTVNVYKMVQNLLALSDGRYKELEERFRVITDHVEAILSHQPEISGTALVMSLKDIDRSAVDQVGAKMANLGEIRNRLGLRVPDGFAVTAAAARYFRESGKIDDEVNRRLQTLDVDDLEALYRVSTEIQDLIRSASLPDDLDKKIREEYSALAAEAGMPVAVAMRSSARGEDSMQGSFAGQYRTRLNVAPEDITETYKDIVAGKFRSQAIVYRQQRGYQHQDVLMCVGCLTMVDAVAGGVAYSRPPDDPRGPWVVIHATPGLGNQIVDGSSKYDQLQVARQPPHDIVPVRLSSSRRRCGCMTESQVRELTQAALRIEQHFGSPQDIEWAIDRTGALVILQARPIGSQDGQGIVPASEREAPNVPPLMGGGVVASRGVGAGEVFKVTRTHDLVRFPKDAVLVVEIPYPEWAVLINRAAAVVSESGQAATHLATVAREFGVPALFDLPEAMAKLENGQIVTVDATARRIYAGRIESLIRTAPRRPKLMEGSPIHMLLQEALTHITPLHLTAPDSPYFRPSFCRTLHDITRFCHEKALHEMFRLGHRYGSRDKSAKQLYVVGMPSQWWVINLDDGFRADADLSGPFIRIEDIVSEPMLAIWQGINAVPWQGPPPVSFRGLGSIIAQSAMNPQLDPAVRSNMSSRNYFLLSRNYCNLSVRLGYHFALAEASFSDLLTESYVNFQFQGGAADEQRKRRRVEIIGELLREIDFRVDVKGDSLTARIEKRPVPYLRERLMVLGYLLMHTRQVDMAMDQEHFVSSFLDRIHADIRMIRETLAADSGEKHEAAPQNIAG